MNDAEEVTRLRCAIRALTFMDHRGAVFNSFIDSVDLLTLLDDDEADAVRRAHQENS